MTPELENRAKQIFERNFGSESKFVEEVKILHLQNITGREDAEQAFIMGVESAYEELKEKSIPSIVQALMEAPNSWNKCDCEIPKPVDPFDDPAACRDCNGYIPAESTGSEIAQVQVTENSSDTESKIQPGQKLQDGDYMRLGKFSADQQIKDIFDICGFVTTGYVSYRLTGQIVCVGERILTSHGTPKTKHSFADFKQLCINTFQG